MPIPEHLREPLKEIGAKIIGSTGAWTDVHVPGADHDFRFERVPWYQGRQGPQITVSRRHVDHRGLKTAGWESPDEHMDTEYANSGHPDDTNNLLHRMVRGNLYHNGPYHSLTLEQHFAWPKASNNYTPGIQRQGRFSYDLTADPKPDFRSQVVTGNYNEDSTEAGLLHGAFEQRPHHFLNPLLDYLAEKHGHGLPLINDNGEEGLKQYARDLDELYQPKSILE